MPVRRLQRHDHTQWLNLRRRLWPECPRQRQLIEMKQIVTDPKRRAVFVFDRGKGRLGGFVEIALRESIGDSLSPWIGYIEGWYVQPQLRRKGTGRELMAAAEQWTIAHGLYEISSSTEITNRLSVSAHRKLGFEESFRLVHFLKELPRPTKR